jgi:hypothetical protein
MTKGAKQKPKPSSSSPKPTGRYFVQRSFWLLGKHGRFAILMAAICFCVFELADALRAFAGKQSTADLHFGAFADIRFAYTVSMAVGAAGAGMYLRERSLHRKTRERLAARNTDLEKKLDPDRTSSLLTSLGLTRQEDE